MLVAVVAGSGGDGGSGEQAGGNGGGGQAESGGSGGNGDSQEQTVQVGEPITVGNVEWTVNDAQQTNELQSDFGTSEQGNFVVVDFTFLNNGDEAVTLDTVSMTLVDGQGRSNEADSDKFEYIPEGRDIFLEQVNPGVEQEGTAIFTVAQNAQDFTLELGDTDMFGNETGYVELGF